MDRLSKILRVRDKLRNASVSIGTWMQIPHSSVAEILGQAGYDWVAVDLEHGSIGHHQLPDLFRALELGDTLPLARLAQGEPRDCKAALDAGAGGVIIPMIETVEQLEQLALACKWPPSGTRGVGFSRANLFGRRFQSYTSEAQQPLLIAQIEHVRAVENLEAILQVPGLDAIMIGPYDLSASMGLTAQFEHPEYKALLDRIRKTAAELNVPSGVHVVDPCPDALAGAIAQGFRFIAYSLDGVFLEKSSRAPSVGQQQ